MTEDKALNALQWIMGLLRDKEIPFQVTGGLAAIAYGATRPLADIDFDFPEDRFNDILPLVRPFVIRGPEHFKDESWDLQLMTLNYRGQEIDLGGAFQAKIYDRQHRTWVRCHSDFSTSVIMPVLGMDVPVIEKSALIAYKTILARDVDLADIKMISGNCER